MKKVEEKVEAVTGKKEVTVRREKVEGCRVVRGEKPRVSQGWVENKFLPANWRCRQTRANSSCILLLSPDGDQFVSHQAVLDHLRSDGRYSREDIQRFEMFPDGVLRRREPAMKRQKEDQKDVEDTREGRETVLEMEDQGKVEDIYELEIKMIEQRTNLEKSAPPVLPSLPAGISFSRVNPSPPASPRDPAPPVVTTYSEEFRFSLESNSISEFQNVFNQLETFKRNNLHVGENKRLKSSFDEIDCL